MGDASVVQVVKAFGYLLEKASTSRLRHLSVHAALLNKLMERDAADVIGNDGDLFGGLDEIVHSNDVRVVDLLESKYLSLYRLPLHAVV